MGWNPFRDIGRAVSRVASDIWDVVEDVGENVGRLELDDYDWEALADFGMTAAEYITTLSAAVATGGVAGILYAGADLIGLDDEILSQLGLTGQEQEMVRQERDRQRQAWIDAHNGGGGSSGGMGSMIGIAALAVGVIALAKK